MLDEAIENSFDKGSQTSHDADVFSSFQVRLTFKENLYRSFLENSGKHARGTPLDFYIENPLLFCLTVSNMRI